MKTAALGVALILFLPGCATILSGTSQVINVSTSPIQADLTIKYGPRLVYQGPAPYRGKVKRKFNTTVEAKAPGYHTQFLEMKRGTVGWYRLNLILLNLLAGIDRASGAAWKILKPVVHIKMIEREEPPVPEEIAGPVEVEPPPPPVREPPPVERPAPSGDRIVRPPPRRPRPPITITSVDLIAEDDYDGEP